MQKSLAALRSIARKYPASPAGIEAQRALDAIEIKPGKMDDDGVLWISGLVADSVDRPSPKRTQAGTGKTTVDEMLAEVMADRKRQAARKLRADRAAQNRSAIDGMLRESRMLSEKEREHDRIMESVRVRYRNGRPASNSNLQINY
jgi:hypothetical protein